MMDERSFERDFCAVDKESCFSVLRQFFSEAIYLAVKVCAEENGGMDLLEEIRFRAQREIYITVGAYGKKKNISTGAFLSEDELKKIFNEMCSGSLYAYSDSIAKGYISLPNGIRVGVCGHAAVENGRIIGVYDVSALNIRIPRADIRADRRLLSLVRQNIALGVGTLIFSPPSQGKTTCLRSLSYELASGGHPLRVSVVDTRGELSLMPRNERLTIDMLRGYPKAEGIRMATLFMNPEVIVCDEIGGEDEARSIADAQNCGVPLIATAHGDSISSLMRKRGILALHKVCAFGSYASIRIGVSGGFDIVTYSWEEAERTGLDNRLAHSSS